MFHFENSYYIPNAYVLGYSCKTNLPSNTAFRGFGGPQGTSLITPFAPIFVCPHSDFASFSYVFRVLYFKVYSLESILYVISLRFWEKMLLKLVINAQ